MAVAVYPRSGKLCQQLGERLVAAILACERVVSLFQRPSRFVDDRRQTETELRIQVIDKQHGAAVARGIPVGGLVLADEVMAFLTIASRC